MAADRPGELSSFWDALVACGGDLSCLLALVGQRAAEIVGEASVLTVLSDDGGRLEPVATYHPDPDMAEFIRQVVGSGSYRIGEGIAGRVAAQRTPAVLNTIAPETIAEFVHPSGRIFAEIHPIRALLIVPMIAGGELVGTLGVVRTESDVPYEKDDILAVEALAERAAVAIADARRRNTVLRAEDYAAIYQYSVDGVMFTVPDGRVVAANWAACEILGLSEAEICARGRAGLLVADDPATKAAVQKRVRTGRVRAEVPMRRGNGDVFTAEVASSIFTTSRGEVRACVIFRDVSEQVALREQLVRQAKQLEAASGRDALTNLRNRRGFVQAANEALAIANREHRPVQLLFFDLDRLKAVNDTLGHAAGDALIQQLATAIARESRDVDVSARFGGDEFVLLLFSATHRDTERVIDRVDAAFRVPHQEPAGGFSVGVAEWLPDSGETLERLVERADHAMYEAKLRRRFAPM